MSFLMKQYKRRHQTLCIMCCGHHECFLCWFTVDIALRNKHKRATFRVATCYDSEDNIFVTILLERTYSVMQLISVSFMMIQLYLNLR